MCSRRGSRITKSKNRNNNIFPVCGLVRTNRYFDRWNEEKEFPRNRGWKTDRGDGSWPKKGRKKRKGGKNTTTPFIPLRQSFVLEEWLSLCSRRTRQRFQLYPLRRLLAAFYFAARRSAVKLHRYNRVSRFEEKSVAGVGAYRFFQSAIDCLRRVSRYHRQRFVFSRQFFFPIQRNFRSIEFSIVFLSPVDRRRVSVETERVWIVLFIIKIKAHGGFFIFSYIILSRNIYENCFKNSKEIDLSSIHTDIRYKIKIFTIRSWKILNETDDVQLFLNDWKVKNIARRQSYKYPPPSPISYQIDPSIGENLVALTNWCETVANTKVSEGYCVHEISQGCDKIVHVTIFNISECSLPVFSKIPL